MENNALFYGDNLIWLRDRKYFLDESVDLIYLDPPFNSKAEYNVLFNEPGNGDKSQAQIKAFDDTWHWSSEASKIALDELAKNKPQIAEFISWLSRQGKPQESTAAYLSMMAVRLGELHRILRPSGSIYLHCDSTASHYLKMVMDTIFGSKNFRNEIAWHYNSPGWPNNQWGRKHDCILFYTKGKKWTFNLDMVRQPYSKGMEDMVRGGVKGGLDNKPIALHPLGKHPDDVWNIPAVVGVLGFRERLGFQTQKPLALLERIIKASSNEGDIVLDPFCGCGTTIDAAQKLNRRWLGIDVTWLAIYLVEKRLKDRYGAKITSTYEVRGKPYDVASAQALFNKSPKEFEIWAISLVDAQPREHDGGVDGIFGFVEQNKTIRTIIVQVKGGDALNPGMVRDLIGTVKKEGAAIGLLITLKEPSAGMKALAIHSESYKSELWNKEFPSIQIKTVGELFDGKGFDLPPTQSPLKNAGLAKEKGQQIIQDI